MLAAQSEHEGDLAGLEGFESHAGIHVLLENFFGGFGGYLLDIHAARGRGHEDGLAFGAIDEDSEIEFFFDRQSFFDQQAAHDAAFGPGLVRDQSHAEHFGGEFAGFVHRFGDLDPAALAAASGMDLRFDDNAGRA